MLIPNSALLENTDVIWTLIDNLTRTMVRVGVAYRSPVKQDAELILQATQEHEATLNNPAPDVVFAFPQQDVHLDGNITLLNPPQIDRWGQRNRFDRGGESQKSRVVTRHESKHDMRE